MGSRQSKLFSTRAAHSIGYRGPESTFCSNLKKKNVIALIIRTSLRPLRIDSFLPRPFSLSLLYSFLFSFFFSLFSLSLSFFKVLFFPFIQHTHSALFFTLFVFLYSEQQKKRQTHSLLLSRGNTSQYNTLFFLFRLE